MSIYTTYSAYQWRNYRGGRGGGRTPTQRLDAHLLENSDSLSENFDSLSAMRTFEINH